VLSFTFGETQSGSSGSGGGGGAGKVQMSDFSFTARTTKASPQLFLSCAQGKHIKQAILTVRKAGGSQQEYLIIKLNDVLVSSYALGSGEGEREPYDAFALNFVKLSYDYRPQKADGSLDAPVHAGWDLSKNVKI
jgi:type VI secretion system secreted protein Hcp